MSVSTKVIGHEWLIKVSGIREEFTSFTGGNPEREVTRGWNGGANGYEHKAGPVTYGDITVSKDYRRSDESWLSRYRGRNGVVRATITKQQLDENMRKVGKPLVYPDCVLQSMTEPEAATGDATIGQISLVFATKGPAR